MKHQVVDVPVLAAFRLREEQAAAGYLVARKEMVRLTARVRSVRRMVSQHPTRVDYRAALAELEARQREAAQRTGLAFERWQAAQRRSDSCWTATQGRAAA